MGALKPLAFLEKQNSMMLWKMKGRECWAAPPKSCSKLPGTEKSCRRDRLAGFAPVFSTLSVQVVHHSLSEPRGFWEVPLVSQAQGSGAFQGSCLSVNVPVKAVSTLSFRICDTNYPIPLSSPPGFSDRSSGPSQMPRVYPWCTSLHHHHPKDRYTHVTISEL